MSDTKLDKAAKERLDAYYSDIRKKRLHFIVSLSIAAVFFFFVFALSIGGWFSGILAIFGLTPIENEPAGIYTDCSLAKNRSTKYCQDYHSNKAASEWSGLSELSGPGRKSKFKLTEP